MPGLRIFGPPPGPERVGPVSFELDGVHAHDVSEILDRHGSPSAPATTAPSR